MIPLRDSFRDRLIEAARADQNIIAIDCDVASHSRMTAFRTAFPDRFIQAGASEQHAISLAAGYARAGKKPVVAAFAAFIGPRAFEQVRNSIGLQELPVLIVGSHAGVSAGEDGASHQAYDDIALFRLIPNFKVHAPGDASDVEVCLSNFLTGSSPSYMRYGRNAFPHLANKMKHPSFRHISGDGAIAVVSTGEVTHLVLDCLTDAELRKHFTLFHVSQIEPLPPIPDKMLKADRLVSVEDHYLCGGLHSSLTESMAQQGLMKHIIPIAASRRFGETGDDEFLRVAMGLDRTEIARKLRAVASLSSREINDLQ